MRRVARMAGRALRLWPCAVVLLATAAGAVGAMAIYRADRDLSVGTIRLSAEPGHRGALDIYVPLVDWGARFHAVRLPARLRIEARTVDSRAAGRVATGEVDVERLRADARDAVEWFIRRLIPIVFVAALAMGALVAFALRGAAPVPLAATLGCAGAGALAIAVAVALLLPPHDPIENPDYYANGSQIPVALRVAQQATDSASAISQDLDDQLLGLARLISVPRRSISGRTPLPRLTVASDLHNNLLALPALVRAADDEPLFFAGDLTTSGIPLEAELTREVTSAGQPFVFVAGNHDSDTLERRLAESGAIVLTQRGRLLPGGGRGRTIVNVAGLRVAGYSDPFKRLRSRGYRATEEPEVTDDQKEEFWDWLQPLVGRIDVVMVHAPALAETALAALQADPPPAPLLVVTGHTHEQQLDDLGEVVVVNGGTIGGGGAGNFHEDQPFGLAVVTYERAPFDPLAVDMVTIDPRDSSAGAERTLLNSAG
jgi:predicted phosphodiesterase